MHKPFDFALQDSTPTNAVFFMKIMAN